MPIAAIGAYVERLPARIAELKMAMAEAGSIPHMKKGDRETTLRDWRRTIEQVSVERALVATPARLRLMGIGVKRISGEQ